MGAVKDGKSAAVHPTQDPPVPLFDAPYRPWADVAAGRKASGTKFIEQFWDYQGFALRQPIGETQGEARDFTWISQELAKRTGLLEAFNAGINKGAAGVPLSGDGYDFSLDTEKEHDVDEIWNAICQAASCWLSP